MTISISGQVPAEAQNGMSVLEEHWTSERTPDAVYAIVKIERDGIKFKDADQSWSATMKFSHIEPLDDPADVAAAVELLEKACGARGGQTKPVQPELDIPVEEPPLDLDTELADKSDGKPFEPEVPDEISAKRSSKKAAE